MKTDTTSAAAPRRGVDWGHIAEGLSMVGIGLFLLATTMGKLPWSFWLDVIALWPILLVSVGVRLIFERSPLPWGVLLSPVITLGALFWVAQGTHEPPPVRDWTARSLPRAQAAEGYVFKSQIFRTRLDLEARDLDPGLLVDGRMATRNRGRLETEGDEKAPTVRLNNGSQHGWSVVSGPAQRWELGVTAALPMELRVQGFANRLRANLEHGRLSAAKLDGAFNDYELRLPPLPARPAAAFAPTAPVASGTEAQHQAKSDAETVVELRFNGAFSNLRIVVPRGTRARVRADSPFNIVDGGSESGEGPRYEIRVQGAFNHLSVEEG